VVEERVVQLQVTLVLVVLDVLKYGCGNGISNLRNYWT